MADFHQNGVIATIHKLGSRPVEEIEAEIHAWSRRRPVSLLLPSLYSELSGPALPRIVEELAHVPYLDSIVVPIGRATRSEFEHAIAFFDRLPQPVKLLWLEGPGFLELIDDLRSAGLPTGEPGKGRACWLSLGYILAEGRAQTIALHDADILTYERELLARLVYPIVSPSIDYDFCKGFYARFGAKLYGRVTRLLMFPLLRALAIVFGSHPYLDYLSSFRYPLAGEFALDASLARVLRVPYHWGLEIGVLSEVFRNHSIRRICQSEVLHRYDHKHQEMSAEDSAAGLHRMAVDVSTHLLRTMAQVGIPLDEGRMHSLLAVFRRTAQDAVATYWADAAIDGLAFDRHEEEQAVDTFVAAIRAATAAYSADPVGPLNLPNWTRVSAARPKVYARLLELVRADGGALHERASDA
jgi:glucosyl-3-phosphoglycerate synthase